MVKVDKRRKMVIEGRIEDLLSKAPIYLEGAYRQAAKSPDTSNQGGAILLNFWGSIIGRGYNDFPEGVPFDKEKATTRPTKYKYFVHGERKAIFQAAREGRATRNGVMYSPWAVCSGCARALIESGISDLVIHTPRMLMTPLRWQEDVNEALKMLIDGGVRVHYYDKSINAPSVYVNNELWNPNDPVLNHYGNWFVGMDDQLINENTSNEPI